MIDKKIHERIIDKKIRLEKERPLPPSFLNRLRKELMIEYTYDSNAIEGSTLTLNETRLVIEEGITIGKKSISEVQAAKNHPKAIEYIEKIVYGKTEITEETVLKINHIILDGVEPEAGKYRKIGVRVTGATFTPTRSNEVPEEIRKLLEWLKNNIEEYTPILYVRK